MLEDTVISTIVRDKDAPVTLVEGDPNAGHTMLNDISDGTIR